MTISWRPRAVAILVTAMLVVWLAGMSESLGAQGQGTPVGETITPEEVTEPVATDTPDTEDQDPTIVAPATDTPAPTTPPEQDATATPTDAAVIAADAGTTSFAFDQDTYYLPDGGSFTSVLTVTVTGSIDNRTVNVAPTFPIETGYPEAGIGPLSWSSTASGDVSCTASKIFDYVSTPLSATGSGTCVITATWSRVKPGPDDIGLGAIEILYPDGGAAAYTRASAAIVFGIAPTVTATMIPTNTPTNTPTDTPTATPTATATATNTPTATPTNTPTATPTNTPTSTPTNTVVPTSTPTSTPTNSPTHQPTATIEATATPTTIVTSLPSTGAGDGGAGSSLAIALLGLGTILMLGAVALRRRRTMR